MNEEDRIKVNVYLNNILDEFKNTISENDWKRLQVLYSNVGDQIKDILFMILMFKVTEVDKESEEFQNFLDFINPVLIARFAEMKTKIKSKELKLHVNQDIKSISEFCRSLVENS